MGFLHLICRNQKMLIVAGGLVGLAVVAPFTGPFVLLLIIQALIFGILAMSLDVLLGYTGLPSLGQAAHLGVGAYLTGVLWVHLNGIVSPEDIILTTSVDALLMVVLGGPGTLVGGAIGVAVVVFVREYLSTQVTWWQYVLGAVYIMTILYLPDGLMGHRTSKATMASALWGQEGLLSGGVYDHS